VPLYRKHHSDQDGHGNELARWANLEIVPSPSAANSRSPAPAIRFVMTPTAHRRVPPQLDVLLIEEKLT
jgi:hypothetical protein